MSAAAAAATALSELVEEYENMWYKQKRLVERMGNVEEEMREMFESNVDMQRQMDDVRKVVYKMQKSIDQMKTRRKNMNDEEIDEDLILSEISAEEEERVKQEHQPKKSKKDERDASG